MNIAIIYSIVSVLIVSLISFIGVFFLAMKPARLKNITMILVSFSAGTMLGGAFLHLLPEAVEANGSSMTIWASLLAGIIVFFILEKIIYWRHCHIPTSDSHPHPFGKMNLIGDGLHNFIDGVIIASAFLIDIKLGAATSLAVIAHEIPQEIGDFGVLLHAGYRRGRALFLNFITALMAVLGAILALAIGVKIENFSSYIIPFTAGGFLYIATADLIPELKKDVRARDSLKQLAGIVIGILLMLLLKD